MLMSDAFDYVNVMDKGLDASWLRMTTIANNLANVDTPNYKRTEVDFQDVLDRELRRTRFTDAHAAVKAVELDDLEPTVYRDHANYSYRIDRNNVDVDTENVELASEQLRYQTISTATTSELSKFSTAIGS
ncbi:MAG: flagellar basal body rod protein FlgB [Lachnospiraceae bacterium]|nr:flagellar basal body rod protein FlgB [Lachnospiraceae bacterium]